MFATESDGPAAHSNEAIGWMAANAGNAATIRNRTANATTYPAGTAFVDSGHGHVHSAFNPSTTDVTVFVATFFEAPAEGPLLIPADAPAGCVVP